MEKSMISPTARFSGERPPRLRSVLLPEANPFEARVCPCRIVAPARRAPRGVGMSLDADLPQADVRQSEFLVPVHCPLQTNGRSGHIIELHRSSRGNR